MENTVGKEKTRQEASRPEWDRRYRTNRSPNYKKAVDQLNSKGEKKTNRICRAKGSSFPDTIKEALERSGISVFFIVH